MSADREPRRRDLYYNLPPITDPDAYSKLVGGIYQHVFTDPFPADARLIWGSMLAELLHNPQEARDTRLDDVDIMWHIVTIQNLLTLGGIALGSEIQAIHDDPGSRGLPEIDQRSKYRDGESLRELTEQLHTQGKTIGLVHGAFDPWHIGHGRLMRQAWEDCDHLIVAADGDALLRSRKGAARPHLPLAARLWSLASLPTVDTVTRLPLDTIDGRVFTAFYRDHHIDMIGIGEEPELAPILERRMQSIGGRVYQYDMGGKHRHSSTKLWERAEKLGGFGLIQGLASMRDRAVQVAQRAIQAGYPVR